MSLKFKYFEYVQIRRGTHRGKIGVIFGCAEPTATYPKNSYAVYTEGECVCYEESSLKSTGDFGKESDFYGGESIKVSIDKDGNGTIV